jgi:sulfate permease, SulP family
MNIDLDAWLPKSVILLRTYDRHKFLSDLIAGITVGLVALPLAMSFAIASKLSLRLAFIARLSPDFLFLL